MKATVLALLLAGSYANECVGGCGFKGVRLHCAEGTECRAVDVKLMETQMDVAEHLCRSCGTAAEPRALGCCKNRRLRDDSNIFGAEIRQMECKRYLSANNVEGIQCEKHQKSTVLSDPKCFRYTSANGAVLEEVQCEGHLQSTEGETITRCVRNLSGDFIVCSGNVGGTVRCSMGVDDAAAEDCERMMMMEEESSHRQLGGGKRSPEVIVVDVNEPQYKSYAVGNRVPAPLTPMPHNPWSPNNIPAPIIRSAPLRPVAPTPVIFLDHQIPAEMPTRRLSLLAPNSRPRCTVQGCGPSVAAAPAVVVQRDTVTTVVRETSCPDGMSLEGTVCVGLDLCPVQYTCPRGFVESGLGNCVTETQPLVDCPDGYTLHGGKVCARGAVTQASYVCDSPGYVLDPLSKVCLKEVPQPSTCPPGYFMEQSSCIQKHAPQLRCDPTQTLSPGRKECVSTYSESAVLTCPEGSSEADGERCVVVKREPPHCPQRFRLDVAANTCVQNVPKVADRCAPGFTRNGRTCERVERSPAEPRCPDGFELRGDRCHKEVPQESRCPAGTVKSSFMPNVCEKCVPSKPECTEGTLQGGQCVVEVEQPSKECCAPGFNLDHGQCIRIEVTAPRLSCEGECYTVHSYAIAYACPVASEFVPHPERPKCVRRTTREVCEPEPLQCGAAAPGECQATNPCSDVVATDTVPAEPYCPEGGSLEGNRCVVREPIVPERHCAVGTLDKTTGQCTRTTTAPIKSECPAGSTRKGQRCVTHEFHPASFVCPQGSDRTVAGICVIRADAIPVPNIVAQQPPSFSCPSGAILSGRECLSSTVVEVQQICPAGTLESSAGCYTTAALIYPPPVEKQVRPSFYCANRIATLTGRQCTVTNRAPAEPYCAGESYLNNGQCVRTVPQVEVPCKVLTATPRPFCDSRTAELRGCVCIEHEETQPLASCASGYSLSSSGKCERHAAKTPLCPYGTQLQGDACVRRVEVAPIVRVINGCEISPMRQPVCYNGY